MKELSLHILDIAKNSVRACATLIEITIEENIEKNYLLIDISDNGSGMSEELLLRVKDPFATTRTTRRVGMGIPLLTLAAEQSGGGVEINSLLGVGTRLSARFLYDHIDRAPLGDMAETAKTLIAGSPETDFLYTHRINNAEFILDTREIKKILGEVPINSPEVLQWIGEFAEENLSELRKNVI